MVKSVYIEQLFGRFNYNINMNRGGVTIITGPNGFGKSTILKIISAIADGDLLYFIRMDFQSLKVEFDNEKTVVIKKDSGSLFIDNLAIPISDKKYSLMEYRRRMPWIRRTGPNTWLDIRTDKIVPDDEIPIYYLLSDESEGMISNKEFKNVETLRNKIQKMKEWSGQVRLISEQRLIRKEVNRRNDEEQVVDVISELPKRLRMEISKVSEEYSAVANKLDSSYPKRLFAAREGLRSKAEYRRRLDEANQKFEKLNKYNLVDMSLIDEQNYEDNYSTALKIYFDDFSEKYKVFESLIQKLDLFTKIINERLTFKEVRISRQNGFDVVDIDRPEKSLSLNQLSSGEKQEIVLFYELIFDTKSDLLLLIDEPEISLHITWQKKFLNDLLEIAQNTSIQVIVATHSPQIVSDHWDIQTDLGELYGKL